MIPITEKGQIVANAEKPENLLPTTSGFFFGSTDYDEYYIQYIKDTIEILVKVLASEDGGDVSYYYQSSW